MKIILAAAAATALIGGAAFAQEPATQPAPATASAPATTGQAVNTTSTTTTDATGASVTTSMTTNGPVPDTKENRAKYGGPMSHAGKRTAAKGN
jgi:hypothetical protein